MAQPIHKTEVQKDINIITQAMKMASLIRYTNQRFWEQQTEQTRRALAIDEIAASGAKAPRSESVADHSWHMSYMVTVIAPRFPELNLGYCLQLSTLHDLPEIYMGDEDPLGKNGDGTDTHAFNTDKKKQKDARERAAVIHYIDQLNDDAAPSQKELFEDALELHSPESRFVKALDRLQPYFYIMQRKDGIMEDGHIDFTTKYLATYEKYFPALKPYHDNLQDMFLTGIAEKRHVPVNMIKTKFGTGHSPAT